MNKRLVIKEIIKTTNDFECAIAGEEIIDKLLDMERPHEATIHIPGGGDNNVIEDAIKLLSTIISIVKIVFETYLLFRDNFDLNKIEDESIEIMNRANIDTTAIDLTEIIIEIKRKIE